MKGCRLEEIGDADGTLDVDANDEGSSLTKAGRYG